MLMDSLLEYFKDLHWQTVDFGGFVNLTDEGVRHLASMKDSIRVLTLSGTRITNASLAIIAEMSDLRELYLDRTFINDEGAKKLCGTLKECYHITVVSCLRSAQKPRGALAGGDWYQRPVPTAAVAIAVTHVSSSPQL